jgi:hypothetical protein
MTLKELSSKLAKLEGKKHEASVGDVRELLAIICEELAQDSELVAELIKNGQRRIKRKK